jgi:hypothetical protein
MLTSALLLLLIPFEFECMWMCGCTSASSQLKEHLLPFILFLQPVTKLFFVTTLLPKYMALLT